jgi:hypothetical protein
VSDYKDEGKAFAQLLGERLFLQVEPSGFWHDWPHVGQFVLSDYIRVAETAIRLNLVVIGYDLMNANGPALHIRLLDENGHVAVLALRERHFLFWKYFVPILTKSFFY